MSEPLYRRVMGEAWDRLPQPIRRLHELDAATRVEGLADVERGRGLPARIVAALFGFPRAGVDVPVTLEFFRAGDREVWRRTFAGRSLSSVQSVGRGRFAGLLVERFGPTAFGLALIPEAGRLRLEVRRWTAFGVPMPRAWAPMGDSFETAEDGVFRFDIRIDHPLTGPIVRYRGWLAPVGA